MNRLLESGWLRGVSLASAFCLMLLVTLLPRGLTTADGSPIPHGMLTLVMWGMSAGFVHGVGFTPHHRLLRVLLGPLAAWLGMATGYVLYARNLLM
ncbi:MAG TPA: cyd operon YbgE family protein [Thiobacillaceae bacterium]